MIVADDSVFPNNAVTVLAARFESIDPDLSVVRRPLRPTDPNQSIGVFGQLCDPQDDSVEFRGNPNPHAGVPTRESYNIGIQAYVKDMDVERGLAVSSNMAEMVRTMLYDDEPLRVGLSVLKATVLGVTKRTARWKIGSQRYLSNEVNGSHIYLSTLELWLETERV
jgi:hypothetical protein